MNATLAIERILAAAAVFVAAHFAMGFINSSAGGTGGSLLFPFATDAATRWAFGSLDGMQPEISPSPKARAARSSARRLRMKARPAATAGRYLRNDVRRPRAD
jgi:hypothetical protein